MHACAHAYVCECVHVCVSPSVCVCACVMPAGDTPYVLTTQKQMLFTFLLKASAKNSLYAI